MAQKTSAVSSDLRWNDGGRMGQALDTLPRGSPAGVQPPLDGGQGVRGRDHLGRAIEPGVDLLRHGAAVYFGQHMKLRRDELPLHFEGLRLRRWIVLAGWPLALAAAGVGVVLVGTSVQPLVDAVGLALGVLGAVLIAGLARCRRFEIVVGPSLLTVGAGPFRRRVPIGALGPPEVRAARSWRPVYADRELVLDVSDRGQRIIFPSADPEGLQAALTEAKTGVRTSN